MFLLQNRLNTLTIGEEWRSMELHNNKPIDFKKAIRIEISEYEDSFDWKWWKNEEDDIVNARMELIDVLHFIVSYVLQQENNQDIATLISDFKYVPFMDPEVALSAILQFTSNPREIHDLYDYKEIICAVFYLSECLEMDPKEVFTLYKGKNILNIFRQENGYKEGIYTKVWNKDFNGMTYQGEDNKILSELMDEYSNSDDIMNRLQEIYNSEDIEE